MKSDLIFRFTFYLTVLFCGIHPAGFTQVSENFFDDPDNFVRIGHKCTQFGFGRIDVIEYNLPLHTHYYWEDTELPGNRPRISPGTYYLVIVKPDGCTERFPYTILDLTGGCTIEYQIIPLEGCCYNELRITVKSNGIPLRPSSYRVQWTDMPGLSSNSRTYLAYTPRTFTVNVQLNGNCCSVSQTINTPARTCPFYYTPPTAYKNIPAVALNTVSFNRRGNQPDFDMQYFSVIALINPELCKTLIDIRNKRIRITQFGRGATHPGSLVPVTRVLTFRNVPEFQRITQGTVINLHNQVIDTSGRSSSVASGIYHQTEFERSYSIYDTALFELSVIEPDSSLLTSLSLPSPPGNEEIALITEIDNSVPTVYYASREPEDPDDYFETRDHEGYLVKMLKYYYGFGGYSNTGGNYAFSRVPDHINPVWGIYGDPFMDFLRVCECPETEPVPLLASGEIQGDAGRENELFVYPNPTNVQTVNLELQSAREGAFELEILTPGGTSLLADKWQGAEGFSTRRLFLDFISPGVYLVKVSFPDRSVAIKKLIVL